MSRNRRKARCCVLPESWTESVEKMIQYEDEECESLVFNETVMGKRVKEVKVIVLGKMTNVLERADDLDLCILLPPPLGSSQEQLETLEDDHLMSEYRCKINRCKRFRLRRRQPGVQP